MRPVHGLHHITAIAGPAQENLDFYAGILGMRLVKRSINQDDPGTYHLFYADAEGHPGTDLTFFPWEHMAPSPLERRFGDTVLPLVDPHGMRLALTESGAPHKRDFAPWSGSPTPEDHQIRGLYGAQIWEREQAPT